MPATFHRLESDSAAADQQGTGTPSRGGLSSGATGLGQWTQLSRRTALLSLLLTVACGGPDDFDPGDEDDAADEAAETSLATTVRYESFDSQPYDELKPHVYPGGTITHSTQIRRAGAGAARFRVGSPQLTPTQCGANRYRSEMFMSPGVRYGWDDGVSHWIGFSLNPTDFRGGAYTLFQIHAPNEPAGSPCDYAGNAISIIPAKVDGQLRYQLRVIEHGGKSAGQGASSNSTMVWSEPMQQDKWADFIFNFTLSTKGAGHFKVWRNGQLIYSKSGLTNVNYIDSCGALIPVEKRSHNGPHLGIYGPPCGSAQWMQDAAGPDHFRELLVDELRVAAGPDGYALVDPARKSGPTTGEEPPPDPTGDPSLVANYQFAETSGATAHDSSSYANHASLVNGPLLGSGILRFDGVNDRVDAPASSSLNITGNKLTIAARVNFLDAGRHQIFIAKPQSASAHTSPYFAYSLHGNYVSATALRPRFWLVLGGSRREISSSVTIGHGWHHVAGVYDGAKMVIYVDGIARGSLATTGNITSYATPLRIGANGGPGELFKGALDDVRVYKRALTAAEVASLAEP